MCLSVLPLSLLIYLSYVDLNLTRVIEIHAAGFIHNCIDSPCSARRSSRACLLLRTTFASESREVQSPCKASPVFLDKSSRAPVRFCSVISWYAKPPQEAASPRAIPTPARVSSIALVSGGWVTL